MASLVLRRHCMLCLATVRHLNLLVTSTAKQIHSSSYNDEAADIVISGGGMVGNAMACALGHEELLKDKKIIVLEGAPKKHFKLPEKFSNRTVAISPSSKELFSSFGAWDEIEQMRTRAVTRMQVWEACSDSLIHFDKKEMDEPLAYIVENDVVQEATTRRLEEVADTVKIRYNTTAKSFIIPEANNTSQNSWVQVELEDGNVLKTKLLIGADGMNSAVRKAGNFRTYTQNYNQMAVVATLKLAMTEDNCVAWQRFLPTGPIAMLPLSEEYSNLIWTTTPENARHLKELPTDSFVDAVNDAFIHDRDVDENAVHVGSLFQSVIDTVIPGSEKAVRQIPPMICDIDDKSRASFPLSLVSSYNYVSPRVALIGDAAHRVHPLAGQGVNLGFGDVICLRDLLVKCVENGGDVGSVLHLQQYETSRQRAVIPIMATIHGLNSLYKTTFPPVVIARSLGLQASNSLSFVKNFFMSGASSSKVSFFSS